jgi:hypothetical protein
MSTTEDALHVYHKRCFACLPQKMLCMSTTKKDKKLVFENVKFESFHFVKNAPAKKFNRQLIQESIYKKN